MPGHGRPRVTLVYLTDKTASSKWIDWEITESLKCAKGVIGAYKGDTPPAKTPLAFQKNGYKAVKWERVVLVKAVEGANTKR